VISKFYKVGLPSFCLLILAASISILLGARRDQSFCFGPPVHNWAWQFNRICLLAELASIPLALVAVFRDKRKLLAVLALSFFIPLQVIDTFTGGCKLVF
jgi:hypothetical protein